MSVAEWIGTHGIFNTEGFLEICTKSCSEWDLNPQLYAKNPIQFSCHEFYLHPLTLYSYSNSTPCSLSRSPYLPQSKHCTGNRSIYLVSEESIYIENGYLKRQSKQMQFTGKISVKFKIPIFKIWKQIIRCYKISQNIHTPTSGTTSSTKK